MFKKAILYVSIFSIFIFLNYSCFDSPADSGGVDTLYINQGDQAYGWSGYCPGDNPYIIDSVDTQFLCMIFVGIDPITLDSMFEYKWVSVDDTSQYNNVTDSMGVKEYGYYEVSWNKPETDATWLRIVQADVASWRAENQLYPGEIWEATAFKKYRNFEPFQNIDTLWIAIQIFPPLSYRNGEEIIY